MKKVLKSKIISIIAIFLCFVFLFGCSGSGGNSNETPPSGGSDIVQPTDDVALLAGRETTAEEFYKIGSTVHSYDVKDGSDVFIENSSSDYVIVYSEEFADSNTYLAVSELQNFIRIATGARLSAKPDTQYNGKNKILSIGNTIQAESENNLKEKVKTAKLGSDGYVIETIGDSVYMLGNTHVADVYAVYEFLHWQFGYEAYSYDTYYISTGVTTCKLKIMNIIDVPDFESRTPTNQSAHNVRMRSVTYTSKFNTYNNKFVHNFWQLIPPSKYYDAHQEWFTGTGDRDQLCLNAHGNKEERDALIQTVFDEMVERLEAQPDTDWIAFCHNDGGGWCTCDACTAENGLYDHGSNSAAFATLTRFVNELARKIKSWNETNCPDRNIKIFIYSYGKPNWAPVKVTEKNGKLEPVIENGKYLPYSDELILEDNVAVFYCGFSDSAIESSTTSHSAQSEDELFFADSGDVGIKRIGTIQAIMSDPTMYIWTYSAFFDDYLIPNCVVDTRKINYQFFKSLGAVGVFDQCHFNTQAATHFAKLEEYVSAKLLWNCKLDVEKLIDNFLKYYYKDAYVAMKTLFDEYRTYMRYLQDYNDYGIWVSSSICRSEENFPYQRIQRFLGLVDNAYRSIEPLKESDLDLYNELYEKILLESITWRYLDIKLYPENYSSTLLAEMKEQFITDALLCKIDYNAENSKTINMFG